jgi:hypothetical protein
VVLIWRCFMAWWHGWAALLVQRLLRLYGRRCGIQPPKGRGGAGPGSGAKEV